MIAPTPTETFRSYVATLGRGQGRSRGLTRDEARDAFSIVLAGKADPHQLGAFLMLLRYRGEDPEEISGLVEAARAAIGASVATRPDLDWPSYGSGKTRGAPWFLLAALALADTGVGIIMHGTNEFTGGITVEHALAALGRPVANSMQDAAAQLETSRFAFLPLAALSPMLAHLIGLRALLGLRSPVNTVVRLLDPADANASVDGVFHPPYIALHLGVAQRLARQRLVVLKGGGGEAERSPVKPVVIHLHDRAEGQGELLLPALIEAAPRATPDTTAFLVDVWTGADEAPVAVATVVGTIAMALIALHPGLSPADADARARDVWQARRRHASPPLAA